MLFTLSLLLSVNSWFFLPSASGQLICDCEKIIKEKKCDNPNCITICNLQNVLNSFGEKVYAKCMEKIQKKGFKKKKNFPPEKVYGSSIKRIIKDRKEEIIETNQKNGKILKQNCKGCNLSSKVNTEIRPEQAEQKCNKYVQTNNFRLWKKATSKNKGFCTFTDDESVIISKEQRRLCKMNDEYKNCCALKHLSKTYRYKTKIRAGAGKKKTCGEDQMEEINKKAESYMDRIIGKRNKKLWTECPKGCSFHIIDRSKFNDKDCSRDINLEVICTHKRDSDWIGDPIYKLFITYEGDIKCNK